jgi:hypothetical protein
MARPHRSSADPVGLGFTTGLETRQERPEGWSSGRAGLISRPAKHEMGRGGLDLELAEHGRESALGRVPGDLRRAELAAEFDGPILPVSGDSHNLRVDAGVPWFSLYGATPQANVTQLVVDRSLEDDADFVRLHVDPKTPGVFSWGNVTVHLPAVP